MGACFFTKHLLQITDDDMCRVKAAKVQQTIHSFATRVAAVSNWCNSQTSGDVVAFLKRYNATFPPRAGVEVSVAAGRGQLDRPYAGAFSMHELKDPLGESVREPSYTAIACSPETVPGCETINSVRVGKGWPPLSVYVCPLVLNERGAKVSSTDIRAAEGGRKV